MDDRAGDGDRHDRAVEVLNRKNGPSDDLETWADALELKGEAREEFVLAGALARSP